MKSNATRCSLGLIVFFLGGCGSCSHDQPNNQDVAVEIQAQIETIAIDQAATAVRPLQSAVIVSLIGHSCPVGNCLMPITAVVTWDSELDAMISREGINPYAIKLLRHAIEIKYLFTPDKK